MNNIDEAQNLNQKVHQICKDYLQGPWKRVSAKDIILSQNKGGLSSGLGLYMCALPDSFPDEIDEKNKDIPRKVLIRFHNSNIRSGEEIVQESVVFSTLSQKNLGPKLCGLFPGGRIEQYVPSRSTDCYDFSDLYIHVAKEVAKFHSLQMPLKKIPMFKEKTLEYLENYEKMSEINPVEVPDFISSGEFRKEVDWMMKEIKRTKPKVVFCHNDLQGGNILLLNGSSEDSEKRIQLIDFEFSAYNYRCWDIAYYFVMKCLYFKPAVNTILDFTAENYPTKTEQEEFIRAYVNQLCEISMELKDDIEKENEVNNIFKEMEIMKFAVFLYLISFSLNETINPRLNLPYESIVQTMVNNYKAFKEKHAPV